MNDITPKEAIANLNHLYGFVSPDIQRSLDVAIKALERPQSKWIKIFENPFVNGYKCPFCGHKIQVTEKFLPEVTECEACGADMRGGAE